ncbi:MAG: DUF523 domain-containing protein [Actinomycetota bacterium]|nr:DUF523 domain-containing protein [Actinomycetota bacterium]
MYIVSACLAGFKTRYDGTDCLDERVRNLVLAGKAIPVCPEQLGGLSIPREPVEFAFGDGKDALAGKPGVIRLRNIPEAGSQPYAQALLKGAQEVLRIARLYGAAEAILKDGSPSCGTGYVHSGGRKISGTGVTAELLLREGIIPLPLEPQPHPENKNT